MTSPSTTDISAAELKNAIRAIRVLMAGGITHGPAWEQAKERLRIVEQEWNALNPAREPVTDDQYLSGSLATE